MFSFAHTLGIVLYIYVQRCTYHKIFNFLIFIISTHLLTLIHAIHYQLNESYKVDLKEKCLNVETYGIEMVF